MREVCHKAQPCYQSATLRVSYKTFQIEQFLDALEEQDLVALIEEMLFAGNECQEDRHKLTAEEIARAKQRAHKPGQKRKNPSNIQRVI